MIRLPLAARELSRVAKKPRMFWLRMAVVAAAFVILFFDTQWAPRRYAAGPEVIAETIAVIGTVFQFAIVFLVLPGITGALLADERRTGALSLLMVANYSPLDIFLAKFICAFAEAEMLLLGTLPILAISTILGGISTVLVLKQWAVLSVCAFTACALGLFTSAFVRHAVSAILTNAILIATLIVLDFSVHEILFWNFRISFYRFDFTHAVFAVIVDDDPIRVWWPAFALVAGIGVAAVIGTVLYLPHAAIPGPRRRLFGPPTSYGATHRRLLRLSPAAPFIAAHTAGFLSTLHSGSSRRTLAVGMALLAFIPGLGILAVLFLLCYDITLSLGLMRREGALDDLTLTRIGERRLARDVFRFHLHRAVVYFPAFVVFAIQVAVVSVQMWNIDVLTTEGYVYYYKYLSTMPKGGLLVYQFALLGLLLVFMAVQGPVLVAIACAAGVAPESRVPGWVRAVGVSMALYTFIVASMTVVHVQFLVVPIFRKVPWFPSLAWATLGVAFFITTGLLAMRRLRERLGVLDTTDFVNPAQHQPTIAPVLKA